MAGSVSQATEGYNCNWLNQPSEELVCQLCKHVAREPYQHGVRGCGRLFCGECVDLRKNRHPNNCPVCDNRLNNFMFYDERSAVNIKSLKVRCNNVNNGCPLVLNLEHLDNHLQNCDHALLTCPNECQNGGRIATILRRDLDNHIDNECPRRQYQCPHCGEMGEYRLQTTDHLETCPNIEVSCPNAPCEARICRFEIPEHRTHCHFERVQCKYATIGCQEVPLRRDLRQHEEDDHAHLRVAMTTILQQQRQIKNLTRTFGSKKVTFRMANFDEKRRNQEVFFSPPFHTSQKGYKMRVEVHPNGCEGARNTHVTIAAHLLKGDNDDILRWPFTGTVTFEILNQLEDRRHFGKSTVFRADDAASQKVVEAERGVGFGTHRFISHQDLGYNREENTQYLKDDTLVFRVSTEIPNYKPWLEPTQ